MQAHRRYRGNRHGFTLLELLTVMMIGIILMSISAAAYYGLVRSSAISGSVSSVRTVLCLGRQNAITSRKRTYILFDDEGEHSRLCIAQHVGTHTGKSQPNKFRAAVIIGSKDEYVGSRIFNIDSGEMGTVTASGDKYLVAETSGGSAVNWVVGDRCAILIHDWADLPQGLMFKNLPNDDLYFKQDGSAPDWGSGGFVVEIAEDLGGTSAKLRVDSISGTVTVILGSVD